MVHLQRVAMINVVLIGLGSLIGTCRAQTGVAGVAETKGQELMQHLQTLQGRAQAAEVRAIAPSCPRDGNRRMCRTCLRLPLHRPERAR